MKKYKQKAANAPQAQIQNSFYVPAWIVSFLMVVWAAVVMAGYLKVYPFSPGVIGFYFSANYQEPFSLMKFMVVSLKNLLSASAALLIFFSANGLGKLASEAAGLDTSDKAEKFTVDTAVGLAGLMFFITAAGMAGLFYIQLILSVLVALAAVNIYKISKDKFEPGYLLNQFKTAPMYSKAILLACAFIALLGSLTPETFYDAISYHVSVSQYWVNVHAIKTIFGYESSSIVTYVHTLYATALMLGNEISAKFINFSFAVMSAFAALAICKRYFDLKTAVASLLLFAAVPLVVIASTRIGLEYPLIFIEMMAVYFALRLVESTDSGEPGIKWAILSGVFIGIAVASKYTSGGAALGISAALAYYYISGRQFKKLLVLLPVVAAAAAIAFSPWMIRNYAQTGHPLYPFVFNEAHTGLNMMVHGHKAPMTDMAAVKPGLISKLTLPWELTMGSVGAEGYIGPAFLLLLPLLFMLRKPDKKIKFMLVYFVIYYLYWTAEVPYLRYFISAVAVFSIPLGRAVALLPQAHRKYFLGALACVCLINIMFAMGVQKNIQDPLGVVTGMESKYDYLSTQRPSYVSPYYNVAAWINDNLPKSAKVMVFCDPRGYYIKRNFIVNLQGDYCPLIETINKEKRAEGVYAKLKSEGVTHLLINSNELKRTPQYDAIYWDAEGLKTFHEFWKNHVRLAYADIADISIPNRDIYSMKLQQEQWWQRYSSDPKNYVYLYEIIDEQSAKLKPEPPDFLLMKDYYPQNRWELLENTAQKMLKG